MKKFVSRAPTRADLAGGTLDIWPLFCILDGAYTVNVALDLWEDSHFEVGPSTRFELHLSSSADTFQTQEILSVDEVMKTAPPSLKFPARLIFAFLAELDELPKIKLQVRLETDVPRGSGLGGSSALAVSLLRGLWEVVDRTLADQWQQELLRWVQDFEAQFLQVPTGTQDYLASIHGGLSSYGFRFGIPTVQKHSESAREALAERMVVLFSGDQHQSGLSNWEIYRGVMENQAGYREGLSELKGVSDDVHQAFQAAPNWQAIGNLLNREWDIRSRVFKVNTPRLDEIVTFLRSQDILGCKVCGAAQGGSLLVLCEPQARAAVAAACLKRNIQVLPTKPVESGVVVQPT